MFGRRFAYEFGEGDSTPWERLRAWKHLHHHHSREALAWHMRRKLFGHEGPFGPNGPFGPGGPQGAEGFPGPGKRFFGRGDLKYALLELLQERPMHGYEMMKELQDRSGGVYTPSPGSIYPTLQMLQDRGFVMTEDREGKKIYTITDAGRTFLAEARPEGRGEPDEEGRGRPFPAERGPARFWHGRHEAHPEMMAFWQELRTIGPLFGSAIQAARRDPEKMRRLQKLFAEMRTKLAAIIGDTEDVDFS